MTLTAFHRVTDFTRNTKEKTMADDSTGKSTSAELTNVIDEEGLSPSTARVYRAGWQDFQAWCSDKGVEALPANPQDVAYFLKERDDLARSTLRNRVSAIRHVHRTKEYSDPTASEVVREAWRQVSDQRRGASSEEKVGLDERVQGWAPSEMLREGLQLLPQYFETITFSEVTTGTREREEEVKSVGALRNARWKVWSDPLIERTTLEMEGLLEEKRQIIPPLEYDLVTLRDRAMLLLIAVGGARRSEVVGIDVHDVFPDPDRGTLLVGLRKANGMPKRTLEISEVGSADFCTARAVAAWILVSAPTSGPLFRSFNAHESLKKTRVSPSTINLVIERRAGQSGLDPDEWSPTRLKK